MPKNDDINFVANVNRRQFMAIGVSTAAISAVTPSLLADPISLITKPLRIPSPSLARAIPSNDDPTKARLIPNSLLSTPSQQDSITTTPTLTLTPLPCVDGRLDQNSSVTIELHYPTPNLFANIYTAHNITIPNQSIPVYPSSTQLRAPRNALGQATLRITQRIADRSQSKLITFNTKFQAAYLLAIPTATNASNASFRFTSAHLDTDEHITKLTNPMPAASSLCAYFSITINDSITGA